MSTPEATTPEEFDPIFTQGVLVVGGHAVNLWGSYYQSRGDPELKLFAPFISKDGDIFLKDKELAKAIAAAAGWKFRDNPEARSTMIGHIYLMKGEREIRVDVLRSVNGVNDADLAATVEISFVDGSSYLLPVPGIMLKAKLANLNSIKQETRQDERHVRIMIACCKHYLADVYKAALAGQLAEREAVERYMVTLEIIRSEVARKIDTRLGLRLVRAIPQVTDLTELGRLPRLSAFYQHQILKASKFSP